MSSFLSSSTASMSSATHLSYIHSQDPGEDSQRDAFAMIDKLVNLDASSMWDMPSSSVVAEHSCMKCPQSTKGIQSLARNADAKNLQEKIGIYDWIDSQSNVNGDVEQVSPSLKSEQCQLEEGTAIENRKAWQERVFNMAGANDTNDALVTGKETPLVKQQNKKVRDTDGKYEKGEAESMDIGANTQIALEAMDILRCGIQSNDQRTSSNEKQRFGLSDTGHKSEAYLMSNNESAPHSEKAKSSLSGIGIDTQSAIDVIDAMRHGVLPDISLTEVKSTSFLMDIGNDTQTALDAIEIMRHGIEIDMAPPKVKTPTCLSDSSNNTQTAIQAIDVLGHMVETDSVLSIAESGEVIEQGLREADVLKQANGGKLPAKRERFPVRSSTHGRNGRQLSKETTVEKQVRKKRSSRGLSKTSSLFHQPAAPDSNSSKIFLLDFSNKVVPRRKRSRLCVPRGTLKENLFFRCQEHGFQTQKPLAEADKQAQPGKPESFESIVFSRRKGNSPQVAVLTVSTYGESARQTTKKISRYTSMGESRKRRKCEPRCVFVLFSHSLSESTVKEQKKMLIKLRGHVATEAAKATHFVADSFARSRSMLEIMAAGKPVVTTMWLEGCSQAKYFVDENSYILQDAQKEKQWNFCMHSSLASSRRKPLFKGMKVVVSPSTAPDFDAIKAVVECAGGQAMQKLPISSHSKANEITSVSFVIGSEEDFDFCAEYLKKGCKVYSTELILHGVITQSLDFSRNGLFEDYVP